MQITTVALDQPGWHYAGADGYTATFKVQDTPGKWGVLGGRISKLSIQDSAGQQRFNYDRGFDVDELDARGREFLNAILERFNGQRPLPWWAWCCVGFTLAVLVDLFVTLLFGERDADAE